MLHTVREISIGYSHAVKPSSLPIINSSTKAYNILREIWNKDIEYRETAYILLLNKASRLLGYKLISLGGTATTIIDSKLIYQSILMSNASAYILAHNHPSGNLKASAADKKITQQLKESFSILDISFLDHLIVTVEGYYSFADEGNL